MPKDVPSLILALAMRDTVDPHAAAKLLGLDILSIEQVTLYRREYQLGANTLFSDVTGIVGGEHDSWRVVDFVPQPSLALTLTPLVVHLLDAPYEWRPFIKHTTDGPTIAAVDHHFAVPAGELVIRTSPESTRVQRITLTNERTVRPTTPTLRVLRTKP